MRKDVWDALRVPREEDFWDTLKRSKKRVAEAFEYGKVTLETKYHQLHIAICRTRVSVLLGWRKRRSLGDILAPFQSWGVRRGWNYRGDQKIDEVGNVALEWEREHTGRQCLFIRNPDRAMGGRNEEPTNPQNLGGLVGIVPIPRGCEKREPCTRPRLNSGETLGPGSVKLLRTTSRTT